MPLLPFCWAIATYVDALELALLPWKEHGGLSDRQVSTRISGYVSAVNVTRPSPSQVVCFQRLVNVVNLVNIPPGSCWRVLDMGGGRYSPFSPGLWGWVRVAGHEAIGGSQGVGGMGFSHRPIETEGDRGLAHGQAARLRVPNQIGTRPRRELLWRLGIPSGPATGHR